jgi:hypothetical protein
MCHLLQDSWWQSICLSANNYVFHDNPFSCFDVTDSKECFLSGNILCLNEQSLLRECSHWSNYQRQLNCNSIKTLAHYLLGEYLKCIMTVPVLLFWVVTPCGLTGRQAVCSSETLVWTYKPTRRRNPEQHRYLHRRENLNCHTSRPLPSTSIRTRHSHSFYRST